mgnify:CR=1 FL=1
MTTYIRNVVSIFALDDMSKCHAVARSFINHKGILEDCFNWFLTVMDNHKISISKIKLFKMKTYRAIATGSFSVLLNNEDKFLNVIDLNLIINGLVKINEFNQRSKCE